MEAGSEMVVARFMYCTDPGRVPGRSGHIQLKVEYGGRILKFRRSGNLSRSSGPVVKGMDMRALSARFAQNSLEIACQFPGACLMIFFG